MVFWLVLCGKTNNGGCVLEFFLVCCAMNDVEIHKMEEEQRVAVVGFS